MNQEIEKIRLDKWLWGVRLYKTRSIAAESCEKGRIKIKGISVKPGRAIKPDEIIDIHRGPWHQTIKILKLTQSRMSASLVKDFYIDITPAEEIEKLRLHQTAMASWGIKPGSGRPTKKDRREMDEFMGDW
jgi:ribosome-associated heat shock protein Hsp15